MLAFCARYGNQRIADLRRMPMREIALFQEALLDLVKKDPGIALR